MCLQPMEDARPAKDVPAAYIRDARQVLEHLADGVDGPVALPLGTDLHVIHRHAHDLARLSGRWGVPAVRRTAQEMERLAIRLLREGRTVRETDHEAFESTLCALRSLVDDLGLGRR